MDVQVRCDYVLLGLISTALRPIVPIQRDRQTETKIYVVLELSNP